MQQHQSVLAETEICGLKTSGREPRGFESRSLRPCCVARRAGAPGRLSRDENPRFALGLVVLGRVDGEVAQQLALLGDHPDVEVVNQEEHPGRSPWRGRPRPPPASGDPGRWGRTLLFTNFVGSGSMLPQTRCSGCGRPAR